MADNFDKFLPDWQIGTLTLTANSTDFTATDALLTFGSIQQGDFIISPDGRMLVIESITDDNSGVLSTPCPPEAAGTFQTRIRYQSDNSRYTGQTAALRRLMSGGNLFALAKLVGDPEFILRYLGNGAFDLVDPVTLGIQDPNGSLAKLAALVLAANKVITTDNSGDAQQIDLGALGRALLALETGTNAQYVQGDGTLQEKTGLPVSAATQTALNGKASLSGATFTGSIQSNNASMFLTNARNNTGVGQLNFSPFIDARIGGPALGTRIFGMETVGSDVQTIIEATSGGTTAQFRFYHYGAAIFPGAFTAGSKSFKIDHPKDPYNKYLVYMSTEAPKAGIEDWGTVRLVSGQAEVDLDIAAGQMPGTFAALTQRAIVVSVNNLDSHTHVHAGRITDGKFTIFADDSDCNDEVTWLIKAERADPFIKSHPYCDPVTGLLIPEHEKED
ncbi:hypothetical protein ACFQ3K_03355 [Brucella gallinifaecis]|uniref:Uncharacterized protein n=1 Tax=Brucella gallinifaecis TaxID=215590 RepID=A0A502BL63_9HYPH|nr:hypothetical protein [Brucella gallinifaecis]TPF75202.1 hypothetical protein FHY56_10825 [Brucella gallinifaecis]